MKILYITSLSGKRLNGFMKSAVLAANKSGFEFTLACNTANADYEAYLDDCKEYGIKLVNIDFDRNPISLKNIKAKKQLLQLMRAEAFDIVHCNTPIGGLLGRICAHKVGVKHILYQAHGFHFWKGAPLKNWVLYYPVEFLLSSYTDKLITITKEDYELANKMKAKSVNYVHGVGVDFSRFSKRLYDDRNYELRSKLGISKEAIVLLSVGELNKNKNHVGVIRAISELRDKRLVYVICGEGKLLSHYQSLIDELGINDQIHLVGFCNNVEEYYRMSDLFVFPSYREGIPAAIMEALAVGVPVIASDIRGVRDIIIDKNKLFNPNDYHSISQTIRFTLNTMYRDDYDENMIVLDNYELNSVIRELQTIYCSCNS